MIFCCQTIFSNTTFIIIQIIVTFAEVLGILTYVGINTNIASQSKNRKAADAAILPVYHKPWPIFLVCLTLLLLSDIVVTYLTTINFEYTYVAIRFFFKYPCAKTKIVDMSFYLNK